MPNDAGEGPDAPDAKNLALDTGADTPEPVREALVAEVRRRLAEGELDSELALVETAWALLDGDCTLDRGGDG